MPIGGQTRRLIYKRFNVTSRWEAWGTLFRPPAALRSYQNGHGLRQRGLPTPRPLAVWHRVQNGLKREGYLITETVPDAIHLIDFLRQNAIREPDEARRILNSLTEQAGRMIRDLHRRRLTNRDLKGQNLLVSANLGPWPMPSDREPIREWKRQLTDRIHGRSGLSTLTASGR